MGNTSEQGGKHSLPGCTGRDGSTGVQCWQKKSCRSFATRTSKGVKNPCLQNRAATTNKPDSKKQVLHEIRNQKTWSQTQPRPLLLALQHSTIQQAVAGGTTTIFQGKTEVHLGCSFQKASQTKLAWTSYVDPKFYGLLSRCLLWISGTNAALSDFKCLTQT